MEGYEVYHVILFDFAARRFFLDCSLSQFIIFALRVETVDLIVVLAGPMVRVEVVLALVRLFAPSAFSGRRRVVPLLLLEHLAFSLFGSNFPIFLLCLLPRRYFIAKVILRVRKCTRRFVIIELVFGVKAFLGNFLFWRCLR